VVAGQVTDCTITNRLRTGSVTVIKTVINDNGGTAVASNFTMRLNDTAVTTFPGAASPGTTRTFRHGYGYSVSESGGPSGYQESQSGDCFGTIVDGVTKVCTITNDDIAPSLTLNKIVVNDNGGTQPESAWTLTANGGSAGTLSGPGASGNADVISISTFRAGTYALSETTGPSGYAASNWVCTGTGSQNGNSISLGLAQSAVCTITNDDISPTLTLVKTVNNSNGGTLTADDFPRFIDGNPVQWGVAVPVNAGEHIASETTQPGYTASGWGGACAANGQVSLALGENRTCTITNTAQQTSITVIKVVTNNNGGTAGPNNFGLTLNGNPVQSGVAVPVNPGTYTAAEAGLAGYQFTGFSSNCNGQGQITVALGDSKTCTLTNDDIAPTLTVIKDIVPDTDSGRFNLLINGGTSATNVGDNGTTGAVSLSAGNHVVSETAGTNTVLSDYVSAIGGACAPDGSVSLALGQNRTCTITNTKKGMVKVVKTVSGAAPTGTDDFTFQIRQGASLSSLGMNLESLEANAGNGGVLNFTTKLTPEATYQICETGMLPGWTSTLTGFVPNGNDPSADNSVRCADFTVQPGELKEFSFNNIPPPTPMGVVRTIGFWKNWSSCSGGRQAPILDQTLASFPIAPGQTTSGVYIGDLYVDTCLEAVRILNKSRIDTGRKMASDPAFNMAAQLLAAKLNVQRGAYSDACILATIAEGQAILDTLNFNGVTHNTISSSTAAYLNNLATKLDRYNNNLPISCP